MHADYYQLAQFPIKITYADEMADAKLIPSFEPFRISPCNDNELLLSILVDNHYHPNKKGNEIGQFDSGGAKHGVYQKEDEGYQILISDVDDTRVAFLESDADFSHCTIVLLARGWEGRNYGFNNALMLAFAFVSATKETILIHSSVVRHDNKAYLCLGRSGTGKSTHVSLWLKYIPQCDLMNDDNPIIRYIDGLPVIFGSPWSGKTPCYRNIEAQIGAFIQLQQKPQNTIDRLKPIKGFAYLLPACSIMKWDRRIFNGICDTLTHMLSSVPCYLLGCRPDEEAVRLSFSTVTKVL
jgi:hypothetical protein